MDIRVGTSGWSYPSGRGTWNGLFYPRRGTAASRGFDELAYYAEHFDTVEVNSTFYRQPGAAMTARWTSRTPSGFVFSVKLFRGFTHHHGPGRQDGARPGVVDPHDAQTFRDGIAPIRAAGKLGAVLAQFPASFTRSAEAVDHLGALLRAFEDLPLAVELRHRSWSDQRRDTAALLSGFGAAWTRIDEPKFGSSIGEILDPEATPFAYTRLHGRNADSWWRPKAAEDRYDYLYSRAELEPFTESTRAAGRRGKTMYLYLNNHFAAKSVANATVLKHDLDLPVTGDYSPEMVARYPELAELVHVSAPSLPGTD